MDVSKAYTGATVTHLPHATICYDPFHIMQWVNRALDRVYAEAATVPGRAAMTTPQWKAARWALRTGKNKLTDDHPPGGARDHLKRWITAAKRSRIPAFVALGKRLQLYFDAVLAAVELGLSNALIEGINARGYGHHSAETLTSMIYLTLGGLHPQLPTTT
jgi:transposase